MTINNSLTVGNKLFWGKIDNQFILVVRLPNGATLRSLNTALLWATKGTQYFTLHIGVSTVHVISIHMCKFKSMLFHHFNRVHFRKIGYKLFSRNITYQLLWFIETPNGTTVTGRSEPYFCTVWFLYRLCCGCICQKAISPALSYAGPVSDYSMIARALQLSLNWKHLLYSSHPSSYQTSFDWTDFGIPICNNGTRPFKPDQLPLQEGRAVPQWQWSSWGYKKPTHI